MPIFEAIRLGKLLTGYESEQFLFQSKSLAPVLRTLLLCLR